MMPPISGIQAIAAATFDGKPVDVDFGPGSGSGLGGDEGGIGSWSGMTYIHKRANVLSSNLGLRRSFLLSLPAQAQYHAFLNPTKSMPKCSPRSFERAFTLIEMIVVLA